MNRSVPERRILADCRIVDFRRERIRRQNILVDQGRIEGVVPLACHPVRDREVLDLKGRYVIPGFTDSHTHLMAHGIELQRIDLEGCRSPADCLERLRSSEDRAEVFGVNWDESAWTKGGREDIDRLALDRISARKPVIMRRICGHFAIVNTAALKRIGPKWKIVDRQKGYLYEDPALFLNLIFPPSDDMFERGLELATNEALSLGITSIHEITNTRNFKMFQGLRHKIRIRTTVYTYWNTMDQVVEAGFHSGLGDDFLRFQGIKIFMDGSIGARTAAMLKPYPGTNQYGTLLVKKERLKRMIVKAEENSLQLIIHSLGDRATETVIRAFEDLRIPCGRLRHRIEHLEVVSDRQIDRICRLGLCASMQPNFTRRWQQPGGLYERFLGPLYRGMNPFRKVLAAGVPLVFGSDSMPMGPLYGLAGATGHPDPSCRLDPARAFACYTEKPAGAISRERRIGRIEPGMLCDLAVLDRDPLSVADPSLIKIENVFIAGKPVRGSGDSRRAGRVKRR